jgi:transmembrane sensor
MDELARELASLRDAVVPAWTEARGERLYSGVGQLRRRRRAQRVVAWSTVGLAACGVLYFRVLGSEPATQLASERGVASQAQGLPEPGLAPHLPVEIDEPRIVREPVQLADGSHVLMMSEDAAVGIERNRPLQIALRVESGSARFDVVPNQKREFVVRAGSVEVGVLGTIFDVERSHGRVRVSVSRGKVRVRQLNEPGASIVKAGESAWFDERGEQIGASAPERAPEEPASPEASKRALQPSAAKSRGRTHRAGARDEAPRAAWRSLSQSGDYEGAYRLLQESSVEDDSGALLDAADAARLSGHPEAALRYLREVLDHHRDSPVSPLAAFTMGRILLERLGQPTEAAEAFALARRLAPQGSLAQDALAREVEAWSKAGHPDEAYQRARQYVTSYPQGRRLRAVQLYGGLSAP